tara:strand:- start:2730 stop:3053 length:324 start_codon:yes stop_codon:yes gene_type:complete
MVVEYLFIESFTKNKKKEKKEKFTSNQESSEENTISIGKLIYLGILIYAMVLFLRCKKLKEKFNFLEFLAALFYPMFYLIYRLAVPVNTDNCKSMSVRIAEEIRKNT